MEHLLRDIKDQTAGTLSQQISNQLRGLRGLHAQLKDVAAYLGQVAEGKLPVNHQILYLLQVARIHENQIGPPLTAESAR